jgi:hypothetical protein
VVSESQHVRETLRQEENRLRQIQDHEEAVLVDSRTGQVLWRKVGDSMRIEFDTFDIKWMPGNILTHNHPTGGRYASNDPRSAGSSFSPADIAMLISAHLAELRAVSSRYTYSVRPPASEDQTPNAQIYRSQVQRMTFLQVRDTVTDHAYWVGRTLARRAADPNDPLSIATAEAILDHLVTIEFARSWGLRYERDEVR